MSREANALWRAAPAAALGTACIVAGGLVAAVRAADPSEHGTWAAAYLVLVAGVAQVALAAGQALLAPRTPPTRTLAAELIAWNTGNAAVLVGTLGGATVLVDVGGALLTVALALLVSVVRSAGRRRGWALYAFRLLVLILLVSIPIGLVLAGIRGH